MSDLNAEAVGQLLRRHVIRPWFPRCLDTRHGGFLCDFDRGWRPCGPQQKLLEFQARQTLAAARLWQLEPGNTHLERATRHGLAYLQGPLWDGRHGGWYAKLDRLGRPLLQRTKHLHGITYAIQALCAVESVLPGKGALTLALAGFEWVEAHAHDPIHGGFHNFFHEDGQPIERIDANPLGGPLDPLGIPIGYRDINDVGDLLEALVELHRHGPDPRVLRRIQELVAIVRLAAGRSGGLSYVMERGGGSVCHPVHIGNQLQLISRLRLLDPLLGEESRLSELRRHLMDFCLRMGLDRRRGGFMFAVPEVPPLTLEGQDLVVRRKLWWVQLEGLRSLLLLASLDPQDEPYRELALHQWRYLHRSFVDRGRGGLTYVGLDDIGRLRRPLAWLGLPLHPLRKGEPWKDAFHETVCLIDCKTCLERHPELGGSA